MLPKKNRLHAKKDFDNIFKNGRAVKGRFLLIKTFNTAQDPRIGFIVPARVAKKAVTRNRIKRILADAAYQALSVVKKDMVVLLLKTPNRKEEKQSLAEELKTLINKINE